MKAIRFNSILNPATIGYEYTADSMTFFDTAYRHAGCLGGAFGYYETYGDNGVQHTPLMAAQVRHFTDYCLSLATHILDHAGDCQGVAAYHFGIDRMGEATIKFLATLVYRSDKRQWFNWTDLKVSSAAAKEHDKRWKRVPEYADGSIASAFQLAFDIRSGGVQFLLERYAMENAFWDTLYSAVAIGDGWEKITSWRTEIVGDHQQAFKALRLAVGAVESLDYAKRLTISAKYNSTPKEAAVAA